MRYVAIVLLSTLAGCELADVEQPSTEASTQATCTDDGVCQPATPPPGERPMAPTRVATTRPPIDLDAPDQVETATFGMG